MLNIKYSYSSTQLNLENQDKVDILQFQKDFIDVNDLANLGYEDVPHITVKYGLHDLHPDKLITTIKEIQPIKVILGKTSIFESDNLFDVVKIDVLSKDLRKLNKLISSSLENTDTFKVYSPHITLARVFKGNGQKYIGNDKFEGKSITFDKIVFSPYKGEDTLVYFTKDELNDN